jgi:hypothetical protein
MYVIFMGLTPIALTVAAGLDGNTYWPVAAYFG